MLNPRVNVLVTRGNNAIVDMLKEMYPTTDWVGVVPRVMHETNWRPLVERMAAAEAFVERGGYSECQWCESMKTVRERLNGQTWDTTIYLHEPECTWMYARHLLGYDKLLEHRYLTKEEGAPVPPCEVCPPGASVDDHVRHLSRDFAIDQEKRLLDHIATGLGLPPEALEPNTSHWSNAEPLMHVRELRESDDGVIEFDGDLTPAGFEFFTRHSPASFTTIKDLPTGDRRDPAFTTEYEELPQEIKDRIDALNHWSTYSVWLEGHTETGEERTVRTLGTPGEYTQRMFPEQIAVLEQRHGMVLDRICTDKRDNVMWSRPEPVLAPDGSTPYLPLETFDLVKLNPESVILGPEAGIAAPREPMYDFFRLAEPRRPLADAAEPMQAPRGGITYLNTETMQVTGSPYVGSGKKVEFKRRFVTIDMQRFPGRQRLRRAKESLAARLYRQAVKLDDDVKYMDWPERDDDWGY